MKRNWIAIMLAGAVLVPVVAQAEPRLGSRLIERERRGSANEGPGAVRAAHRLASCMYARRTASVRGVLDAVSPADQERFQRSLARQVQCNTSITLTDGSIVEGAAISTPHDVMRGMYAEAALETMREDEALSPVASQASYTRDWFAITSRDPIVDEMAVCVADQNPAGIRSLLATDAETPAELAAVRTLSPSLGPCLPQGAKLSANRQGLRAALAEALYHRATAPALATSK